VKLTTSRELLLDSDPTGNRTHDHLIASPTQCYFSCCFSVSVEVFDDMFFQLLLGFSHVISVSISVTMVIFQFKFQFKLYVYVMQCSTVK